MIREEESFKKDGKWDMIAIQAECKKRYPIGCTYKDGSHQVLRQDEFTYRITDKNIWAHTQGGLLFSNGKWSDVISLPEIKVEDKPSKDKPFYVVVTEENKDVLSKWFHSKSFEFKGYSSDWALSVKTHACYPQIESGCWAYQNIDTPKKHKYNEITFDQFKKLVLKESDVPKYIEFIVNYNEISKGDILKVIDYENHKFEHLFGKHAACRQKNRSEYYKPSTKEAYDAQFSTKTTSVMEEQPKSDKPMTPAEKLGYKIGDKFIAISEGINYKLGEVWTFEWDDKTRSPRFVLNGKTTYISLMFLKPYTENVLSETPKEEKWIPAVGEWAYRIKNGDSANFITKDKVYHILFVNKSIIRVINDKGREAAFDIVNFRKALPHEIPTESKPIDTSTIVDTPKADPMVAILEEAKKRYPNGVDYKCLHGCYEGVPSNGIFIVDGDCIRTNNECKCCYEDSKWAEIVSLPEEKVSPVNTQVFEVGDTVRIVKKFQKDLFKWTSPMNNFIGTEGVINDISSINGACMIKNWWYLPESLELVKRKDWERLPEPLDVTPIIGRNTSIYTCDAITAWNAIPSKVSKNEPMRLKRLGTTTI
jgi:hypothetical protein